MLDKTKVREGDTVTFLNDLKQTFTGTVKHIYRDRGFLDITIKVLKSSSPYVEVGTNHSFVNSILIEHFLKPVKLK